MFHVKHLEQAGTGDRRFHVKHDHEDLETLLDEELASLGPMVRVPHESLAIMIDYLVRILDENQRVNLTAVREPTSAVRVHVTDSLSALPELLAAPEGLVVDIGSGGGFPGVPLALATRRRTVLLDSVGRKARAVNSVLEAMGPMTCDLEVVTARAEDYAAVNPRLAAVVVARAVAPLPALVELAAPLLQPGGVLIAMKGQPTPDEVAAGDRAAAIVGLRRISDRSFELRGGEGRRILTYERVGESTVPLPRRVGLAQNSPLG